MSWGCGISGGAYENSDKNVTGAGVLKIGQISVTQYVVDPFCFSVCSNFGWFEEWMDSGLILSVPCTRQKMYLKITQGALRKEQDR